jgi:hypothetical protein
MTSSDTTHVDVYLAIRDKFYHVGHSDIARSNDWSKVKGQMATMLHNIAWALETGETEDPSLADAGVEDLGDNRSTPGPRRVLTPQGFTYWEVAPGEFCYGTTWEAALAQYNKLGNSFTEEVLRRMFPKSYWEYL